MRIHPAFKFIGLLGAAATTTAAALLCIPSLRDRFFSSKLWPWPLPWDTDVEEVNVLKNLAKPGDVILESNLHGLQWMILSKVFSGSQWVHAALVDEDLKLLTVERSAIQTDFDIYLRWGSTRLALIRPHYGSREQISTVLDYARTKLGTPYDATFTNHAGNCNGFVGSSLEAGGIKVPQKTCFGKNIYAPDCFFSITDSMLIWCTDDYRNESAQFHNRSALLSIVKNDCANADIAQ